MDLQIFDPRVEEAEVFRDPPRRYAPLVRWLWRGFADESTLIEQLRSLEQNGYGGALIQLWSEMETRAWSSVSLNRLRKVVQEADVLGLRIWLHLSPFLSHPQEPSPWPHLKVHRWETSPGKWRKVRFSEPVVQATAFPVPLDLSTCRLADALDVTEAVERFETPVGLKRDESYRVFAFTKPLGDSPAVPSVPPQVELLLGDYLGNVVEAIVCPVSLPLIPRDALAWLPDILLRFDQDHHHDLLPNLVSLILDTGASAARTRQQFWHSWTQSYIASFWRPLHEWCHRHCVRLVAELGDDCCQREPLAHLALVASLGAASDGWLVAASRATEEVACVRLCSSFSRQQRRYLAIDLSLCTQRTGRLFSRFAGEECRQWITHCVADSLFPAPVKLLREVRWLFPLDSGSVRPLFFARFSWLIDSGRSHKQVAVLLPTRSAWSRRLTEDDDLYAMVQEDWTQLLGWLDEMHFNYDFVCEWDFIHAQIVEGALQVGPMSYAMLVLPSMTALSRFAWAKVIDFVKQGGKVASFGLLPAISEMGEEEDFVNTVSAHSRLDVRRLYEFYLGWSETRPDKEVYPVFCEDLSGGRFCSFQPRLIADVEDARLRMHQIFRESFDAEFESQNAALRYQRRIHQREEEVLDRHLFVITNNGDKVVASKVQLGVGGEVTRLSLVTGRMHTQWVYSWIGDRQLSVPLDIAPAETVLLQVCENRMMPHVEATNVHIENLDVSQSGITVTAYARESNQKPLAEVHTGSQTTWLEGSVLPPSPERPELDKPWLLDRQQTWLPLTHWVYRRGKYCDSMLHRLNPLRKRDWLPCSRGIPLYLDDTQGTEDTILFKTTFILKATVSSLGLFSEDMGMDRQYFLNGKPVEMENVMHWGYRWQWADIVDRVRAGLNELVVQVTIADHNDTQTPFLPGLLGLVGRFFWVAQDIPVLTATRPLSLKHSVSNTIPSHCISEPSPVEIYSTFTLTSELAGWQLVFQIETEEWGQVELLVNGRLASACIFPPYRFDITEHTQHGQNQIVLRILRDALTMFFGVASTPLTLGPARILAYPPVMLSAISDTGENSKRM